MVAAILYALARKLIDVNLFSLNAMYANRLTRCYLGRLAAMSTWQTAGNCPATSGRRRGACAETSAARPVPSATPNPVTGFDPVGDDIDLGRLRIGRPRPGRPELLRAAPADQHDTQPGR